MTVVLWLAVLLAGTGSGVVDDAVAVSVISPSIVVVTMIATVTAAPLAIVPTGHETTPAACRAAPLARHGGDERDGAGKGVGDHDAGRVGRPEVGDGDGVRDVVAGHDGIGEIGLRDRQIAADVTVSMSVAASSVGSVSATGVDVIVAVLTSVGDA